MNAQPTKGPPAGDEATAAHQSFYDRLWSTTDFRSSPSQRIRRKHILNTLRSFLAETPREKLRVLDCGCGGGSLTRDLAALPGVEAHGIDFSPRAIELCRQRIPAAAFAVCDLQSECFDEGLGQFDCIVCSEVIEHLNVESGQENLLRRCAALLAPGGLLILTTPNRDNVDRIRPADVPRQQFYQQFEGQVVANLLSRAELACLLKTAGLAIDSWRSIGPYLRWRGANIALSLLVASLSPSAQGVVCNLLGVVTKYQIVAARKSAAQQHGDGDNVDVNQSNPPRAA